VPARQRVKLSVTRWLVDRLKLKVNEDKSAVAHPRQRLFPGFSIGRSASVKLSDKTIRRLIAILELLYEMRNEVVSRDLLLDRCWGLEYYPESRTPDPHIARMRKAIERDSGDPDIIETVRGIGYRIRQP
jgi:DNA-binding response OmpR family regulator